MQLSSLVRTSVLSVLTLLLCVAFAQAQNVQLTVTPDHEDWIYQIAEPAQFTITVTVDGQPLQEGLIDWNIGPEKMAPFSSGKSAMQNGVLVLQSHGLDRPGFLRCTAAIVLDGKTYSNQATGGYEPFRIQPATPMPADFTSYWEGEIAKLKDLPLDPVMEKDEAKSDDTVDVYHISYKNQNNSRMYGMLALPKGEGPFPAILQVPGAGIRPYSGSKSWAAQGVIHLQIGIHGIPVNLPNELYDSLNRGPLAGYPAFNLDNRDAHYYHRVFLGCVRAVDFIFSLKQFDGRTLGIHGGSQGGALSIITAGLDSRIQFLSSTYPAMCDHYGYLRERAGGWPHLFANGNNNIPEKVETAPYYDVVNFARVLKVPVLMGLGFNDLTCPPTSMLAAYNAIPSAKEMKIHPAMGHQYIQDFEEFSNQWLLARLKTK